MNIPAHRVADLYARSAQATPPPRPAPRAEAPAAAAAPKAASRVAPSADLSAEEARAIESFFPPAPALTLRLYGPSRETQRVAPEAVGGRLDLRG